MSPAAPARPRRRALQAALSSARLGAHRHGRFRRRHCSNTCAAIRCRVSPSPAASARSASSQRAISTSIRDAARSTRPGLAERLAELGAVPELLAKAKNANSALETLELARAAGIGIGDLVAARARRDRARHSRRRPGCSRSPHLRPRRRARRPRRWLSAASSSWAAPARRGTRRARGTRPATPVVTSLAGRTAAPARPMASFAVGGFGGADRPRRLSAGCGDRRSSSMPPIPSPPPSRAMRPRRARARPSRASCSCVRLGRGKAATAGSRSTIFAGAAAALPGLAHRVFLTIGPARSSHLRSRPRLLVPCPPRRAASDGRCRWRGRDHSGPRALHGRGRTRPHASRRIEVIVSKNSGGDATYAKIAAARSARPSGVICAPAAATARRDRRGRRGRP